MTGILHISCEIIDYIPQDFTDDKSTLVQNFWIFHLICQLSLSMVGGWGNVCLEEGNLNSGLCRTWFLKVSNMGLLRCMVSMKTILHLIFEGLIKNCPMMPDEVPRSQWVNICWWWVADICEPNFQMHFFILIKISVQLIKKSVLLQVVAGTEKVLWQDTTLTNNAQVHW